MQFEQGAHASVAIDREARWDYIPTRAYLRMRAYSRSRTACANASGASRGRKCPARGTILRS